MLAYVFWHWSRTGAPRDEYESRLIAFHRTLARSAPPGFTASRAAALSDAPWANDGNTAYEDWYLLENSGALDALDAAAVSGRLKSSHDDAASRAAGGTAGLYSLRLGESQDEPGVAQWFAKPREWTYDRLFDELRPIMNRDVGVWGRRMTLGPAPEFCLHAPHALTLPPGIDARVISLRTVFR